MNVIGPMIFVSKVKVKMKVKVKTKVKVKVIGVETFLLLSLLNSWQLNLLLATKKLSFLISIVLHLLKFLPFLTNSKTFLNFLFLYLLNLSSLATSTFTLILT